MQKHTKRLAPMWLKAPFSQAIAKLVGKRVIMHSILLNENVVVLEAANKLLRGKISRSYQERSKCF